MHFFITVKKIKKMQIAKKLGFVLKKVAIFLIK